MRRIATASLLAGALVATAIAGPALAPAPAEATGSGVQGTGSVIYLNDAFTGAASNVFALPAASGTDIYVGDWDGDGVDTIMARSGNQFTIHHQNRTGSPVTRFTYGDPSDVVLVGDWNGDGIDTVAVRRGPAFHLSDRNGSGVADRVVYYGDHGDVVLVGDWNGDGTDTFAVRRDATYHVRNSLTPGPAEVIVQYGERSDTVVVGDWNGDGIDTLGVVRGSVFHLRNALSSGAADVVVQYGDASDTRFVGDWNGDGRDTIGVRRLCFTSPGQTCVGAPAVTNRVIDIVNAHRANAGLPALQWHGGLASMAQRWSESMATSTSMVHNPTFGQTSQQLGMNRWGENIARGAATADAVVEQWMQSPPHRANILNPRFTYLGVGTVKGPDDRWYWTQNFGAS